MHGLFHEGKIYGCEECTHEAKDEYQFVWQKQMHNGKPKIQYVQCHFEGNTKSALIYHTVNAHKGKKFKVFRESVELPI